MATYYVDQNHLSADDAGAGTSESAPWKTLHRAVDGIPTRESGGSGGPYSPVVAGDTVYAKNGTYHDVRTAATERDVAFNTTNSGTAAQRVNFRAYPGHSPVVSRELHGVAGINNPVIGANVKSYFTWDGFTLGSECQISCYGATAPIIERCKVDTGTTGNNASGNYDGIRMEDCIDGIVRWNDVRNVRMVPPENSNTCGLKVYDCTGLRNYQNSYINCYAGIYDKRGTVDGLHELNYVEGVAQTIRVEHNDVEINGLVFRYNVLTNATNAGLKWNLSGVTPVAGIEFYNNTVYGALLGLVDEDDNHVNQKHYNNIFYISGGGGRTHFLFEGGGLSPGLLSDYNCFSDTPIVLYDGVANRDLPTWQSLHTLDLGSIAQDPLFVGPLNSPWSVGLFKLQGTSPCLSAGRVGGVSGGSAINMGAFAVGDEVIGVEPGAARIALFLS